MSIGLNTLSTLFLLALAAVATSGCAVGVDLGDDATRRVERQTITVDGLPPLDVSTVNGRIEAVDNGNAPSYPTPSEPSHLSKAV